MWNNFGCAKFNFFSHFWTPFGKWGIYLSQFRSVAQRFRSLFVVEYQGKRTSTRKGRAYLASCWTSLFGCSKGTFRHFPNWTHLLLWSLLLSMSDTTFYSVVYTTNQPGSYPRCMSFFPSFLKSNLWQDLLVTLNHLSLSHIYLFSLPTCCGLVQASSCLT